MHQAPILDEPSREALRQAAAALDAAEQRGQPFEMSQALARVARCHRTLGALASAESFLETALRWARVVGSTDLRVDLLCELCESAERLAQSLDAQEPGSGHPARERARDHAFEASTLAGRVADPAWEVTVLLRISDVLNHCGDHDDAAQLQSRAMHLLAGDQAVDCTPRDHRLLPAPAGLADG